MLEIYVFAELKHAAFLLFLTTFRNRPRREVGAFEKFN